MAGVKYTHIKKQFCKIKFTSLDARCYRMLRKEYDPLDAKGSILHHGRYNNGEFFVLYLASSREVCEAERQRRTKIRTKLTYKIAEIKVKLKRVIDLTDERNLAKLDIKEQDIISESWELTQYIARLAYERGCEALIVPSATKKGENIVVLLENRDEKSTVKRVKETIV